MLGKKKLQSNFLYGLVSFVGTVSVVPSIAEHCFVCVLIRDLTFKNCVCVDCEMYEAHVNCTFQTKSHE